jgi:hypothetical protein
MRISQYQTDKGTYTLYTFDGIVSISYTSDKGTKHIADFNNVDEGLKYLKDISIHK